MEFGHNSENSYVQGRRSYVQARSYVQGFAKIHVKYDLPAGKS